MEYNQNGFFHWWKEKKDSTFVRVSSYFIARFLTVLLTIFVGIFITVFIANKSGQFDNALEQQVRNEVADLLDIYPGRIDFSDPHINDIYNQLAEDAGLFLPDIPRHIKYTFNAITLDLGLSSFGAYGFWERYSDSVSGVLFAKLPNTLLLVGTSYLLVFLIGIPISLYLSRNHRSFLDRLFSLLSPLSSIPAWVLGILFIMFFAVGLKIVPPGGMHGSTIPDTKFSYYLDMAKHLALPVFTIVISLLLQFIYIWRTFFLIYSEEDYVDLAIAQGIKQRTIDRQYILRPTLPFIITSFALSLISFWQMIIALEVVFVWPGIGQVFISSLPNFFGESMYPGDLPTTVGVVVIFSYFLGIMILLLDLIYAIVDPRIRLGGNGKKHLSMVRKDPFLKRIQQNLPLVFKKIINKFIKIGARTIDFFVIIGSVIIYSLQMNKSALINLFRAKEKKRSAFRIKFMDFRERIKTFFSSLFSVIKSFKSYPSAIFGITFISIMLGISIFLVLSPNYKEDAKLWYGAVLTGKSIGPKFGKPSWINLFTSEDYPPTIITNSAAVDDDVIKETTIFENERKETTLIYSFEYNYGYIPQEIDIHFQAKFDEKRPFVQIKWIQPDGSELLLDSFSVTHTTKIDFEEYFSPQKMLLKNKKLQDWYFIEIETRNSVLRTVDGEVATNPLALTFINWNSDSITPEINKGTYQLIIEAFLFEEDADLDAEVIMIGQVYGLAGTDYMRRDLLVPLLWGMPYALLIGLVGAVVSTVGALFVAAIGTWTGGWLDSLIDRITEANMVIPTLALGVLIYSIYFIDIWWILAFIILMNIFGSPTKSFKAAFLQVIEAPYIEAAKAYGASNWRIITHYMIPRIMPVVVPQLIAVIPTFVFLEATLGLFNIRVNYPTWGRVIYDALRQGALSGSRYWVLEPIFLLLLTGVSFIFIGNALDKILNPRLLEK